MPLAGSGDFQTEVAVAESQQASQKSAPKSSEELLEVHGGCLLDSVDRIPGNTLQPIAF